MAEVTGLRNNALPYPLYGCPWGVVFPIFDNTGALVVSAAGLDSEVSLNGDTFADCTNEATQIATNSGMYYLLLTAAEMTADVVTVIVKTSTTDAKTTPVVLYPRKEQYQVSVGTAQGGGADNIQLASGESSVNEIYTGMVVVATIDGNVEVRVISLYTGSTKQAYVVPDWNVTPDSDDTYVIKRPDGVLIQTANATLWRNASIAAPATAGIPDVNAKNINNVATTSVTAVNANVGTTQPVNFTGTGGSALAKSDMVDIAGAAVSTSTAQIGVNTVNLGGMAQTGRDIGASVLLSSGTGTGQIKIASGYVAPNWGDVGNPTTTVNLSGTTIKAVTDAVSISAAAVWDYLTSAITTAGSIGKLIKDNLDAAITSRMATYTQPTGFLAATFPTTVASTTNITAGTITTVTNLTNAATAGDFTTTMKTSIGTAVAASAVASVTGNVGGNVNGNVVGSVASVTAPVTVAGASIDLIWDEAVDGTVTARQSLRLANSANGGITDGGATATFTIRDLADTKDRVTATVDGDGNRSVVTRDLT